jgi:mRNA-degrading endonuclease toxin of MazEF toxin-antitoxin module
MNVNELIVKAGKLVTVRNTHTGDSPWIVELYAKRTPVLVIQTNVGVNNTTKHCAILHKGQQRFIEKRRLKVVNG